MSSQRLTQAALEEVRRQLSVRDQALLAQVDQLRLMSGQQIEAVHFPPEAHATPATASRLCRRTLALLVQMQLLVRLPRQVGGVRAGSQGFVYAIAPAGHRLVRNDGSRLRFYQPGFPYVPHRLAVSQLVVELTLASRAGRFELAALEAEPDCWRTIPSVGRSVLRPDLFAAIVVAEWEYRWFVEVDRNTHRSPALLTKARLYESYYRSGVEQNQHGVFPRVVWLTPSESRAEELRKLFERAEFSPGLMITATVDDALAVLSGVSR